MDENALIIKIKKGDKKAFKKLFDLHYHPLCLYLMRFSRDWDTSQEIGQAVFVKFWTKRKEILITTSVKGYIFRMGYNQFLMNQREKNKKADLIDRLTYKALQEHHELSPKEMEQKSMRIKKSIAKLPPTCQEILKLKMSGATYKEIATERDISLKTVESQMRIAYKRLRKDLKDAFFLFLLQMKE